MKRFISNRRSPALVISLSALVLAAGGTAIAGPVASTSKSKGDTKTDKKLFNKLAKTASVSHAATAGSATTATTASNALQLGGLAPSAYAGRLFARVSGSGATPTLAAGSPGVTVASARPFTGAATVNFPVDMTNCAVVATGVTGGPDVGARQSSISSGKSVVIITYTTGSGGTEANEDFNVIGEC